MSELSNKINCFLQSVSSHLEAIQPVASHATNQDVPSDFIISREDVERKLLATNVHKSTGPDDLPNWILRDLSTLISGPVRKCPG